jgi:hypothetical protein
METILPGPHRPDKRTTLLVSADLDPELERIAISMARSSGKAFLANFSGYDASLQTRARLALANSWKKLRTGSGCCGNYGQPGC